MPSLTSTPHCKQTLLPKEAGVQGLCEPASSHALFFIFVLIFKTNATAQNSKNMKLENDMVKIPAGSFVYGTNKKDNLSEALLLGIPKPWYADEGPEQTIFLKTFYIDRYEVTNRRYKVYIDDVSAVAPMYWVENNFPDSTFI